MPDDVDYHRQMTTTETNLDEVGDALRRWLSRTRGTEVRITALSRPETGGMSSATVLFDAEWDGGGESLVARMAPEASAFPVFATYDLERQYHLMAGVGAAGVVPVPPLVGLETDPQWLGGPFIVMKRVPGRVPTDNPPYVFGGWLAEASAAERGALTSATIEVIAGIHAIPEPAQRFPMLAGPGEALRREVGAQRDYYRWALTDNGVTVPIIERAFAWLDRNWPADSGPDVLSWGDARPGNIIYDGFTPVAVLDWEMAALGPRELDLAWMIFLHRFFQDIGASFGHPGLGDFMRRDDVVAQYQQVSGHTVRDLDFYVVYAALRHAIVMARIKRRMIHFGEDTVPADPDDHVMHRAALDALMAGIYQWQ